MRSKALVVFSAASLAVTAFALAGGSATNATSGTWFACAARNGDAIASGSLRFGRAPVCTSAQYVVSTNDPPPAPTTTTTTTVATSTTTTASTTTTRATSTTTTTMPVRENGFVLPGTVGYRGPASALTVYNRQPDGTAVTIGGTIWTWRSYGLRSDATTATVDHAKILGPLYWGGTGTLTVTNSVIDTTGFPGVPVGGHGIGGTLAVSDSTISGKLLAGWDAAGVWPAANGKVLLDRNDLSGFPQGADAWADGSHILNNTMRMATNGTAHMDGVFLQGGNNIEIGGNYIDGSATNPTGATIYPVTAGVFLQDLNSPPTMTGISIHNNFIDMYGYPGACQAMRNQSGIGVSVVDNVFGNCQIAVTESQGGQPAGTYGTFTGNVHVDGTPVPKP